MGGKHKQAQRTKNNARPSSSGRSAELLASSLNPFMGFQTVKDSAPVLPGFSRSANVNDDIDVNLDANFQLVLKKMNKKDSKTKLKALQEFTELVKSSQPEAVKAVLPFWPRLYTVLAVDVEHKVREGAHLAHRTVVLKVRRNLAPYLKQLAGPWFTSQYDTYAPAASAATQAFQDAFPPSKVQEAIAFCQDEILSYICDSLFVQTPLTLASGKTMTTDEAEAKYERLLVCSLQGYVLYLNKLSKEQVLYAEQLNLTIISNAKFWKLSKNKVVTVRAAFYGCVAALCEHAPYLLSAEVGRLAAVIFTSLDEPESTVLYYIWQAALSLISNIPDWSQHVNIEKLVYPKLYRLLREGAAVNIFPNLLPFISHLPATFSHTSFYGSFFQNLLIGMKKRQVVQSRSEFGVVATTFMECLRFVIVNNLTDVAFGESLITTYLIPIIEWCFLEENVTAKPLFHELTILLHYWERNKGNEEFASYGQLLRCFWSQFSQCVRNTLEEKQYAEGIALQHCANKQVELVVCIRRGAVHKHRKHATVTFAADAPRTLTAPDSHPPEYSAFADLIPLAHLDQATRDMATIYIILIRDGRYTHLIPALCLLVQHFDSVDLFRHVNAQVNSSGTHDTLFTLHENVLLNFLKTESTCSEAMVDLVFVFYKYLNVEEKQLLLDSLTKLHNEDCLCWCVAKALSHPYCNDTIIRSWLSTAPITQLLVGITSTMLTDEIPSDKSLLLKQALNQTLNGDLYISEEACKQIISILCNALMRPAEYPGTIDLCASFSAELAATLYTERTLLTYGDQLILALFSLSCSSSCDPESLSADTAWEMSTAWQDAVGLLLAEQMLTEFDELLLKFRRIVHDEFGDGCVQGSLVAVAVSLVKIVVQHEGKVARSNHVLDSLLAMPVDVYQIEQHLTHVCSSALLLRGHITWLEKDPLPVDVFEKQYTDSAILKYLHWERFVANIVSALFHQHIIVSQERVGQFVTSALYSYALARIFIEHFKTTKLYSDIIEVFDEISQEYKQLMANVPWMDIVLQMNNSYREQLLYMFCSDIQEEEKDQSEIVDIYRTLAKQSASTTNVTQLTQIFAKHLNFDDVGDVEGNVNLLITTRALINCDDIDVQLAESLNAVMRIREQGTDTLLYNNNNLSTCHWIQVQTCIEVFRFFAIVLEKRPDALLPVHREILIVSLASAVTTASKNIKMYEQTIVLQYICAVCDLYVALQKFLKNNSINVYCDLFEEDINKELVNIWTFIAERELEKECVHSTKLGAIALIGTVVMHFEPKYIIGADKSRVQPMVQLCGRLLHSRTTILQLWGYHCLRQVLDELVQMDAQSEEAAELIVCQLGPFLSAMQDVVKTMLIEFRIGEDSCRVQCFTDSYTFTFGYLLLWDLLLKFCRRASASLRYQYSEWLRDNGREYLKNLLINIFKLMPTEVLHSGEARKSGLVELFSVKPSYKLSHPVTSDHLEHLVCWLYGKVLTTLPALVRQWWGETDQKTAQMVDQVTAAYVSPKVCAQELLDVADKDKSTNNNMKVKVHLSAREVLATYTVDEARMELLVTLPANYPLGAVQVSCNKLLGGSMLCRHWLMQLTIFVTHQNGRIWEALSLWKSSLDKKFDGVEECYICFSVLHHNTCQLPRLSCQTCKKKFHTTCLYKWFSTSNKSTCPICRNLF